MTAEETHITHLQRGMVRLFWKKHGPHWRRLLDTLAIVLKFQGNLSENRPFLDTQLAIKQA
jgi:hypothetical protein